MIRLNVLILVLTLSFYNCTDGKHKKDFNGDVSTIKGMLYGMWQLTDDTNYVIELQPDSIFYYYDNKFSGRNAININISDSVYTYETENNTFDFIRDKKNHSEIQILEFDKALNDSTITSVLYLSKDNMNLATLNSIGNFKRIRSKGW